MFLHTSSNVNQSYISYTYIYRVLKLTVEQKCDIATRELDELREELQRKKNEFERTLDDLKVPLITCLTLMYFKYVSLFGIVGRCC